MARLVFGFLALLAIAAAVSLLIRQVRLWWIGRVRISEDEARLIRPELLDFVKSNSFGEGHEVQLQPFWRRRRLNEADKRYITDSLFADKILLVYTTQRQGGTWTEIFEELVERWVETVLMPLPGKVLLNPQVYFRMLHEGITGSTIIMEQNIDRQEIDSRTQIVRTGDHAQVGGVWFGDHSPVDQDISQVQPGVTEGDVVAMVAKVAAALRADASGLESPAARQTVTSLADAADEAVESRKRGTLLSVLRRAVDYTRLVGAGMSGTQKVLDEFEHVIDKLH